MYNEIQRDNDIPKTSDFGGYEGKVIKNFLHHLNDNQERALRILAQPRQFDEALFEHLYSTFFNGSPVTFSYLIIHSFVREDGQRQGQYVIHQLMRDYLMKCFKREEQRNYTAVHRSLFEYYDKKAIVSTPKEVTAAEEVALLEAGYHKTLYDETDFSGWLEARHKVFSDAARYLSLEQLYGFEAEIITIRHYMESAWLRVC